jgi:hypothetical protein
MKKKHIEALKTILTASREYAASLKLKKRKDLNDTFKIAVLYRDIVTLENCLKELQP